MSHNFFTVEFPSFHPRHPFWSRRTITGRALLLLGGVILAVFLSLAVLATYFWTVAESVKSDIRAVAESVRALDVPAARHSLQRAQGRLVAASRVLSVASIVDGLPVIGDHVRAGTAMVKAGIEMTAVGDELLASFEPTVAELRPYVEKESSFMRVYESLPSSVRRGVLQGILESEPVLVRTSRRIHATNVSLSAVQQTSLLGGFRESYARAVAEFSEIDRDLQVFLPLIDLAPHLYGTGNGRSLIVVFQNSDEIRPSGGFIGNYGIFRAKDGAFSMSDVRDVYSLDRPATGSVRVTPPWQMAKYLAATGLYFRDANWSPDWPTSAASLLDFYRKENGEDALAMDGVVAVSPRIIQRLAELTGCITVQGVDFCPENIIAQIQYEVEKGYDFKGLPAEQRKQILKPLATEFLRRMSTLSLSDLPRIARIARDAILAKDVMIWSSDPAFQEAIDGSVIAGRVGWTTTDGLMVVDANLGGMKTDPFVVRDVTYVVRPEGDSYVGTVSLRYTNTAPGETFKTTTYRTWTRILLPSGVTWLSTDGSLEHDIARNPSRKPSRTEVLSELGRTSIGAFQAVAIGETRALTFRFRLSPEVVRSLKIGSYALTVLRQPGATDAKLTVDIDFGKTRRVWQSDLSVDRKFSPLSR